MITPTKFCILGTLLVLLGFNTQAALIYNRYDTNSDAAAAALVNGQAAAVNATNWPNAVSVLPLTNALAYALSNNITDLKVQARLKGAENEFALAGVESNVVDILLFGQEFNPTNGRSFLGRTFSTAGVTFSAWGVATSSVPITVTIPGLTNGSMLIVYQDFNSQVAPPNQHDAIAGLSDSSGSNAIVWTQDPYSYPTITEVTNGIEATGSGANGYNDIVATPTGTAWGFNDNGSYTLIRRVETASFAENNFTNGQVTAWEYGMMSKVGNSNSVQLFTNFLTMPNVPLTKIFVGVDPLGTPVNFNSSDFAVKEVMVFNCQMNPALLLAAHRAVQWFEPGNIVYTDLSDSRNSPQFTNNPGWWFQQNGAYPANAVFYNLSNPGTAAFDWQAAGLPRLTNFFAPFLSHGNVVRLVCNTAFGGNDIGLDGYTPVQAYGFLTNLVGQLPSKQIEVHAGTFYSVSSNTLQAGIWPIVDTNWPAFESNRLFYNQLVTSNATLFAAIFDEDSYITQAILNTNNVPQYSVDGMHLTGSAGFLINQKIAAAEIGNLYNYLQPQTINASTLTATGSVNLDGIITMTPTNIPNTNTIVGQGGFVSIFAKNWYWNNTMAAWTNGGPISALGTISNRLLYGYGNYIGPKTLTNVAGTFAALTNPATAWFSNNTATTGFFLAGTNTAFSITLHTNYLNQVP